MLIMNLCEIIKRDLVLLSSFSNFCPFVTFFRGAFKVDYLHFLYFCHFFKATVKRFKDLVLTLWHILKVFHELRENIFIRKYTSLHDFDFFWRSLNGFLKFLDSCENCEHLKGKSPSLWLYIVFLKHIDVLSIEVLPLINRFFNPLGLWQFLSQNLNKCWFATSYITLNCDVKIALNQLWINQTDWNFILCFSR